MFKIAFGEAVGVVERYGVDAAGRVGEGDDHRLLHGSVHHGMVDRVAHLIGDGDTDIAETLVEMDVDRAFVGTSYNGIRVVEIGRASCRERVLLSV